MVCARSKLGKHYGVVVIPEGLIEFIPEVGTLIDQINKILHGEVQGDIKAHVMAQLD
jgi:pyrophosphate--fructose-6-phosphate 1-phosphotransferase